jgi:carbamoyl-phosphate synthase large subunit
MTTLLITGIGGDIAQGMAAIVREAYPSWRLVGMDIHERHGGALYVDAVHRAPSVAEADYDRWLGALIARERVNVCLPTSEAELIHLARGGRDAIGACRLVMANARAVEVGSDKFCTSEFLAAAGIPRPWTIPAEHFAGGTPLPCIFKARRGAGSKAVFVCQTAREVEFYREKYPAAILQELLLPADREVTCAVFRGRDGRIAVLQLLRTLVGGFTGWAQVIEDPRVEEQCRQIAEGLTLEGSINVQLRITDAGPRIFEINPRFSSTVLIRHRMGFRDVLWSIQESMGERAQIERPEPGTIGVRVQGAALVVAGDIRGSVNAH